MKGHYLIRGHFSLPTVFFQKKSTGQVFMIAIHGMEMAYCTLSWVGYLILYKKEVPVI